MHTSVKVHASSQCSRGLGLWLNVDDRNNVDLLRIITRETESTFQLTIGVFSIAFVMSVIEKITQFLNTLTMKYKLRK